MSEWVPTMLSKGLLNKIRLVVGLEVRLQRKDRERRGLQPRFPLAMLAYKESLLRAA